MSKKQVFTWRVKNGSYKIMQELLRFPETTGPEIDGEVCRVTITDYDVSLSLKREFIEKYKNDHVFQVRLLNRPDRDFIVMASLLENLQEPVIVE